MASIFLLYSSYAYELVLNILFGLIYGTFFKIFLQKPNKYPSHLIGVIKLIMWTYFSWAIIEFVMIFALSSDILFEFNVIRIILSLFEMVIIAIRYYALASIATPKVIKIIPSVCVVIASFQELYLVYALSVQNYYEFTAIFGAFNFIAFIILGIYFIVFRSNKPKKFTLSIVLSLWLPITLLYPAVQILSLFPYQLFNTIIIDAFFFTVEAFFMISAFKLEWGALPNLSITTKPIQSEDDFVSEKNSVNSPITSNSPP